MTFVAISAALVSVFFGIRFLIGRRVTVEQSDGKFCIKYNGEDLAVPPAIQAEIVHSIQRVRESQNLPVLVDVIHHEAERFRGICQRRRVQEQAKLVAAFKELLETEREMRLASQNLQTVDKDIQAQDKRKDIALVRLDREMERLDLEKEEIAARRRKLLRDEAHSKLDLTDRRRQSRDKAKSKNSFDDFGSEEEQP